MVFYPEALNQHPGDAIDVLEIFLFSIPVGLVGYLVALLTLLVGTLIKSRSTTVERQALQIMVRAAIPIGAALALFMPILSVSEIANGLMGEAFVFSMDVVAFIAAVIFAWFIMRRSRLLNVPRLFPDSYWVLVLTIPLFIGMAASISSAHQNAAIASREVETEGVIVDCQPHNLCRFTFAFLGRSFEGAGTPATGAAMVGHQVAVFFDTNHPQTNSLEDFARTSRRQMVMVPFCLIAVCAVVGVVVYAGRMQSRSTNHLLNA
jgi:amino acid transporter